MAELQATFQPSLFPEEEPGPCTRRQRCACGFCATARQARQREKKLQRSRDRSKTPEEKARCFSKSRRKTVERREMLARIKMKRGCMDCRYKGHPVALDFDHVNGKKFMGVAQMGTFSLERILAEVAKCQIVCFRCHRLREAGRRSRGELPWAAQRGTQPTKTQAYYYRYTERGRAFLAAWKLRVGCKDCGYREHAEALDFDHVRGKKSFSLAARPWWSIRRLTEEAEKCEVVCANCHRIRTFERHQNRFTTRNP